VGIHAVNGGVYPTHGRISHTPAKNFGTNTYWDGDNYVLKAAGEVHQTKMYSRHLSLRRCVETGLNEKSIRIHDVITNFEAEDEPYMMLYHFNFGYPLLQADSQVAVSKASTETLTELTTGYRQMIAPEDGRGEELYFHSSLGDRAVGVLYNMQLGLGAYVAFDTKNLPNLIQWKMMKSHDYVLALEPCNTCGINRDEAIARCIVVGIYQEATLVHAQYAIFVVVSLNDALDRSIVASEVLHIECYTRCTGTLLDNKVVLVVRYDSSYISS
jgi:hypothetical protein